MLILIAESKTMVSRLPKVSRAEYEANTPIFESRADELMCSLEGKTASELAEICRISQKLSAGMFDMIRDFPLKSTGARAIEAYTGVVFRQLHPKDYSAESREYMSRNLRIVSSLYGILKPCDIIKPYRLEYSSRIAPGHKNMIQYWRGPLTAALCDYLKTSGETEILDLMPADAAKCFDWKGISELATIGRINFITPDGRTMRTPHAGRLKELRGRLLDNMLRHRVTSLSDAAMTDCEDFTPSAEPLTFITA